MRRARSRPLVLPLAAALGAGCAIAVGGLGSIGGVATACAQTTGTNTLPVPTLGPIDPTCSRVPDTDQDGVLDFQDNCQGTFNPRQDDTDNDSGPKPYQPVNVFPRDPTTGGDACDTDDDGDGVVDVNDNCPKKANKDQADADSDGVGDICDANPTVPAFSRGLSGPLRLTIVSLHKVQHVAEIRAGVTVPVRCSHQCAISAKLTVDARTAGRLRMGSARLLGRGSAGLEDTGLTYVFVRLTKAGLARVAHTGSVKATLRLAVSDDGGRHSVVTRRLTIRR
ncbi:MAG: hypothetical protein QOI98_886 [Solirubrobacteraceae bacterium]|nr:hypothetical protein [Solirubrobacteraceae bacterium]